MYDQCVSVFTVKRFHIKATKTDEDKQISLLRENIRRTQEFASQIDMYLL